MQSTTMQLEITYLRTTSLKPDPRNPRVHTDKQVRQIAQSIESFGFNVPILIDDQQTVIAGHGRLQAARKLGWDTVPTIRLSHLTDAQRTAFLIADNRLTENSSWDEQMLGEQLKFLSELELDFDLEAIGFEVPEIDLLIDGLSAVPEADPDDRVPDVSGSAVTVSGDLWQLGKHRVLCGNSLVPSRASAGWRRRSCASRTTSTIWFVNGSRNGPNKVCLLSSASSTRNQPREKQRAGSRA
jgi:ParB-like chromosome segregation protein Spo0J